MTKGGDGNSAKCLAYLAAFIVFQTATLTLFALTVMRIESPKVRFDSVAVTEISSSNPNAPSFSMKLTTQFTIRNTNFGHFKYRNGTLTILYNGMAVGEAFIAEGRFRFKFLPNKEKRTMEKSFHNTVTPWVETLPTVSRIIRPPTTVGLLFFDGATSPPFFGSTPR
ncbi:hypothetical protein RJ640_018973 [Escallonia rubra]|uniref:Late embryogenesis abundant protein LEA-2 subgroup domain-containing protein n=1 Tax=Escallonia rubra TaxID=112253 RepID=A0AA88S8X3_9ASTE|nr:hypothetical protein RJ640_018973 [Escallonia rubra]